MVEEFQLDLTMVHETKLCERVFRLMYRLDVTTTSQEIPKYTTCPGAFAVLLETLIRHPEYEGFVHDMEPGQMDVVIYRNTGEPFMARLPKNCPEAEDRVWCFRYAFCVAATQFFAAVNEK